MSKTVLKRSAARRDLLEVFLSIGRGSVPSARRFRKSAEATFKLLARMPRMGTLFDPGDPELADVRFFPITTFEKYLVFYRPTDDGIEVVRVLHGARDLKSILASDLSTPEDVPDESATDDLDSQ
jgi:toxin ParE1/3/4